MTNPTHSFYSNSPTLRVARREFRRIAARKSWYLLMVIMPLVVFSLTSYIYRNRVVVDIPIGLCDLDNTELSRTLARSFESTRSLKIADHLLSVADIKDAVRNGSIQGAVYIPAGLESDIKRGKPATIVVYDNRANIIIGNLILKDASTICGTISAGVLMKKLEAGGLSPDQALALANPIRVESHALYNPAYNYANFLSPAVVMVLLQMLIMILAVVVINDEINNGTLVELFAAADGKVSAVLWGKSLAHLSVHSATGIGMLVLLFPLLDIPIHGSLFLAIPFMILFIAASFLPGLAISSLVSSKFLATDVAAFYNSPAFLFSGYTFPLWAMPGLHHAYALLLPFTHFLNGFLKVYQYNAPARYLLPEAGMLSIFVVVSLLAAVGLLKYRVKPMAEKALAKPGVTP